MWSVASGRLNMPRILPVYYASYSAQAVSVPSNVLAVMLATSKDITGLPTQGHQRSGF